jgi:cobalt-zinc-cadmium resistance protein CzcA
LGSEFIPDLNEGAIAVNTARLPSVSLSQSVKMLTVMEQTIKELPEVETVTSRIGRPEIATDPMGPEHSDTYVFLKPKEEWKTARTQEEIVENLSEKLKSVPGMSVAFSQPIKFRMNELIEGVGARSDVVIKIFGDDVDLMRQKAEQVARVLGGVRGAADTRVQQVSGLPVLQIKIDRDRIARYGINVSDVAIDPERRAGRKRRQCSKLHASGGPAAGGQEGRRDREPAVSAPERAENPAQRADRSSEEGPARSREKWSAPHFGLR